MSDNGMYIIFVFADNDHLPCSQMKNVSVSSGYVSQPLVGPQFDLVHLVLFGYGFCFEVVYFTASTRKYLYLNKHGW